MVADAKRAGRAGRAIPTSGGTPPRNQDLEPRLAAIRHARKARFSCRHDTRQSRPFLLGSVGQPSRFTCRFLGKVRYMYMRVSNRGVDFGSPQRTAPAGRRFPADGGATVCEAIVDTPLDP
jgi:hypothetical protein